ncbi:MULTISPECIES: hypothetical protein [unclassified Bradyrhizobium]|uniref:hypothetical protein n=1 Tax=unclassified Bradyrhizobium TaxID=2631580 RepID=UPI003398A186
MERVRPNKPTVTAAIRRAMVAVNDQKVFRIYGPNGTLWKCERDLVSPRTLWKLITYSLIEDEPQTAITEAPLTTVRMRLSQAGFDFLLGG